MTEKKGWFTAEVTFDWPTHMYGDIEQAILDALNARGLYHVSMTVANEGEWKRRELIDCASCGEDA
jgi:hypothetical protein